MAHNRLVLDGLEELKAALRRLPEDFALEAGDTVLRNAEQAAQKARNNYQAHMHTGNLATSVTVRVEHEGRFGAKAIVRAHARHAHLFEHGTAARHTSQGRYTGVMPPAPPAHAFIPPMIEERREMYEDLKAMLQREGLVVTGDA